MISFEDAIIRKIDRETTGDEVFDEQVVADWKRLRPNPSNFRKIYSDDEIRRDLAYVAKREKKFEEEGYEGIEGKNATRLSYGVMQGIEMHNWFSQHCMVVPASRYDDIANGVDLILCFTQDNGPSIKIGVDITVNESRLALQKKLQRSVDELTEVNPTEVKYFRLDKKGEPIGKIELPRVVIGANADNTNALFEDMVRQIKNKKNEDLRKKIDDYEIQHHLLVEIRAQLAYFLELAADSFCYYNSDAKEDFIKKISSLIKKLNSPDILTEMETNEFQELLSVIALNREKMIEIDPEAAEKVFKQIEAFNVTDRLIKEKGSQDVKRPRADSTIETLTHPKSVEGKKAA